MGGTDMVTVGRIVHFFPTGQDTGGPVAAIVTRVHAPEEVNLLVFPDDGPPTPVTHVRRADVPLAAGQPAWNWPVLDPSAR
jgi:hypothetical protein